ncbi:type VI immunity family protein, partial [Pseudomonas viridiflava]|uniref:type VI immunity family protein n=1 Tax=Pseudomonas viridiflava TaxID=33069 RepID=UPI00311A9C06
MAVDSAQGMPVVRLGLITTLYFRKGHTQDAKQRVEACFSRFYTAFKPVLKWQLYKRMRRLTPSGFASCRRQVVHGSPQDQFVWSIASATQAEVASYSLFVMNTSEGQAD